MIKVARGYGDLSENSEYDDAKNEQAKLYARIAEVEDILSNAVVTTPGQRMPTILALAVPLRCWMWKQTKR